MSLLPNSQDPGVQKGEKGYGICPPGFQGLWVHPWFLHCHSMAAHPCVWPCSFPHGKPPIWEFSCLPLEVAEFSGKVFCPSGEHMLASWVWGGFVYGLDARPWGVTPAALLGLRAPVGAEQAPSFPSLLLMGRSLISLEKNEGQQVLMSFHSVLCSSAQPG